MYRFLLSRRWLGFMLLALLLAAACVRLGFWQLHRYEQRSAYNARVERNAAATPVPVDSLARVGRTISKTHEWRQVVATGRYDVSHQLLVRQRPLDGTNGFEVLTPLVRDGGPALLVDRGWLAPTGSATTSPTVPAPPPGEVTVVARLRPAEDGPARTSDLPIGQIRHIAITDLARGLPYPVYGSYAVVVRERPESAGTLAQLPLDQQNAALNLAYTVQWWIFAGIALVGGVVFVRREARDRATATTGPGTPARPEDAVQRGA